MASLIQLPLSLIRRLDVCYSRPLLINHNLTLVDLETSDKEIANIINNKIIEHKHRGDFLLVRSAATRIKYDLHILVKKYIDVYNQLANH